MINTDFIRLHYTRLHILDICQFANLIIATVKKLQPEDNNRKKSIDNVQTDLIRNILKVCIKKITLQNYIMLYFEIVAA